jgi:hypothetical protein
MKRKNRFKSKILEFVLNKFDSAEDKDLAYTILVRQIMNLSENFEKEEFTSHLLIILLNHYKEYQLNRQTEGIALKHLNKKDKSKVLKCLKESIPNII